MKIHGKWNHKQQKMKRNTESMAMQYKQINTKKLTAASSTDLPTQSAEEQQYRLNAASISDRHRGQTPSSIEALRTKWLRNRENKPLFGTHCPWSLLNKLSETFEKSDNSLRNINQFVHAQQVTHRQHSRYTPVHKH